MANWKWTTTLNLTTELNYNYTFYYCNICKEFSLKSHKHGPIQLDLFENKKEVKNESTKWVC